MLSTLRITWSESFRFFFTPEFQLYFLLIGNTILRTIKLLTRYFFWLFPLIALTLFVLDAHKESLKNNYLEIIILCILFALFNNLLILCTRASLEPKNFFYFLYYLPIIFSYSAAFTLIQSILFSFFPLYTFSTFEFCINIFFQISLFFFLDTTFSIKNVFYSFTRAIKMLLYFLPFFIIYVGITIGFINILAFIAGKTIIPFIPPTILSSLFFFHFIFSQLFLVATLSVLYISLKHRYYKLFFNS